MITALFSLSTRTRCTTVHLCAADKQRLVLTQNSSLKRNWIGDLPVRKDDFEKNMVFFKKSHQHLVGEKRHIYRRIVNVHQYLEGEQGFCVIIAIYS